MSTYPAGTVAVATVRGVEGVRVMWRDAENGWIAGWFAASGHAFAPASDVTDIRPLVVLDLHRYVTPEMLVDWLRKNAVCGSYSVADEIADQIEAQTKPPRIPEPGPWGVVEDKNGYEYVRIDKAGDFKWQVLGVAASERNRYHRCGDIADPVLIREGVES